jgi:hypothetical protein
MNASDWIGLGIIALLIIAALFGLSQISKPYDVKTEEEFQKRKELGARTAGVMGLQQIIDPGAKKSVEVQQDLRRGIYDDKEEADDPPEAGEEPRQKEKGKGQK